MYKITNEPHTKYSLPVYNMFTIDKKNINIQDVIDLWGDAPKRSEYAPKTWVFNFGKSPEDLVYLWKVEDRGGFRIAGFNKIWTHIIDKELCKHIGRHTIRDRTFVRMAFTEEIIKV